VSSTASVPTSWSRSHASFLRASPARDLRTSSRAAPRSPGDWARKRRCVPRARCGCAHRVTAADRHCVARLILSTVSAHLPVLPVPRWLPPLSRQALAPRWLHAEVAQQAQAE
jgi:hypothetical protein